MTQPRRKPFQRQYADQAMPVVEAIHEFHQELHEAEEAGDAEAELHVLGPLSEAYRSLGQLDAAVTHAERAMALARAHGKPKFVLSNLIRLATAYQYRHQHEAAEPLFLEALALARTLGMLEDYALQHHGKSLAEQGRWDEAIAAFEQALALRTARGHAALIASSEEALAEARLRRPKS